MLQEQINQTEQAEWTDRKCPECSANLLDYIGYFFCSHIGCDFGLKEDIRIGDLIKMEKEEA